MLRVKELTSVLERACDEPGIINIMIVNEEGALVATAKHDDEERSLTYCSAVLASIYNEYKVRVVRLV